MKGTFKFGSHDMFFFLLEIFARNFKYCMHNLRKTALEISNITATMQQYIYAMNVIAFKFLPFPLFLVIHKYLLFCRKFPIFILKRFNNPVSNYHFLKLSIETIFTPSHYLIKNRITSHTPPYKLPLNLTIIAVSCVLL